MIQFLCTSWPPYSHSLTPSHSPVLQTLWPPAVDLSGLSLPVHHGHVVAQLCQPCHRTRAAHQDTGTHTYRQMNTRHVHTQQKLWLLQLKVSIANSTVYTRLGMCCCEKGASGVSVNSVCTHQLSVRSVQLSVGLCSRVLGYFHVLIWQSPHLSSTTVCMLNYGISFKSLYRHEEVFVIYSL